MLNQISNSNSLIIGGKIALGTAQFGMLYGIANQNGQVHEGEVEKILYLASENGIATIDTAKGYGNSEYVIGKCLKNYPENLWEIVTKLNSAGNSVIDQLHDSIDKLNTCPTVALAHSAEYFIDVLFQKEIVEAKESRIILKAGVSLYNENQINLVMESAINPEVIQLPMNILDTRLYRSGVITQLAEKGIEVHVRSAFLQGLFFLPEAIIKERFEDVVPHISKLRSIADENDLTVAELSILWLTNLEEVSKVVIGVDNADQLKMHLQTMKKKVDSAVFDEALSLKYENERILNPSLW